MKTDFLNVTFFAIEEIKPSLICPRSSDGQFGAGMCKMRLVGGAESRAGRTAGYEEHRERGQGGAKAVTRWAVPGSARHQALPGF